MNVVAVERGQVGVGDGRALDQQTEGRRERGPYLRVLDAGFEQPVRGLAGVVEGLQGQLGKPHRRLEGGSQNQVDANEDGTVDTGLPGLPHVRCGLARDCEGFVTVA